MYVLPDGQTIKDFLMTVDGLACIMSEPVSFLISFDATVRLHSDNLDGLTCSQALSHGLHSSIQEAQVTQVLGLSVQTWASKMFAQYVHCTKLCKAEGCQWL